MPLKAKQQKAISIGVVIIVSYFCDDRRRRNEIWWISATATMGTIIAASTRKPQTVGKQSDATNSMTIS